MRTTGSAALTLLAVGAVSAQVGPRASARFTHAPLVCMSAEEFPLVEAVYEATDGSALRSARVFFKAARSDVWYYVDMAAEGSRFQAVLPKPLPETEGVDYYLYFLESSLDTAQSEEYTARVSASGCAGDMRAAMTSPGGILLGATVPNQAAVPLGFNPQGITGLISIAGESAGAGAAAAAGGAGAGGISGTTVGLIAGGVAAAGVGVAAATGGGDGDSSTGNGGVMQATPTPTPSSTPAPTPTPAPAATPTPSPTPSAADLSGDWRIVDTITESCEPSSIGQMSPHTLQIRQDGTHLDAMITDGDVNGPLQGSVDGAGNFTLMGRVVDEGDTGDVAIQGTSNGSEMSGNFTEVFVDFTCTVRGTFTGSRL